MRFWNHRRKKTTKRDDHFSCLPCLVVSDINFYPTMASSGDTFFMIKIRILILNSRLGTWDGRIIHLKTPPKLKEIKISHDGWAESGRVDTSTAHQTTWKKASKKERQKQRDDATKKKSKSSRCFFQLLLFFPLSLSSFFSGYFRFRCVSSSSCWIIPSPETTIDFIFLFLFSLPPSCSFYSAISLRSGPDCFGLSANSHSFSLSLLFQTAISPPDRHNGGARA